jgi:outer membrane protein
MRAKFYRILFGVLIAGALGATPVRAQFVPLDFEVPQIAALGAGALPDYEGSNDYTFGVAPVLRYTFEKQERYIQLVGNELTVNLVNNKSFRVGPILTYRWSRDHNIEDSKVKRMTKIDQTVFGGVFADYVYHFSGNLRHRLIVGGNAEYDLGGASSGFLMSAAARYWYPVAKPVDLFLMSRLNFGTHDYMEKYFGVDTRDSTRSGLNHYTAGGGAKDVVFGVGGVYYLSRNWALGTGLHYSRILGHAADSPVVKDRGSANQFITGLGVAYMW